MKVLLFEDAGVPRLAPVTLGRPAYSISCGGYRLLDLARGLGPVQASVRPHLRTVEATIRGIEIVSEGSSVGPALWINARLAPSVAALRQLQLMLNAGTDAIVIDGKTLVAAIVNREARWPAAFDLDSLLKLMPATIQPVVRTDLPLLEYPHDIIRRHIVSLRENLEHRLATGYREVAEGLFVAEGATIGQHLVTDTRQGPILVDAGASIGPFCYITGPAYLGPGARLIEHTALKDGVTLGPRAKVGGEVEASIVEAYSNKQHHGFLGHSHVGSWVNLGAGTSNSDLKNTYGEVNMDYAGAKVSTGMQFVGCFIGDYTKTAINTGIFTGKTLGACSMVYGFVTTNVPSFTNYARSFSQVSESPVEVAIATQARMFSRRNIAQGACDSQLLRDMYELTRAERANYGEPLPTEPLTL